MQRLISVCLAAATTGFLSSAIAGSDLYFVSYNHYIDKGELELMLMSDFTMPSKFARQEEGQHNYFSQMVELEYGISRQWAVEGMIEAFEEPGTGNAEFTGYRLETRYRLFEKAVPLNPVLYVEYEDLDVATRYKMEISGWVRPPYRDLRREPDRERILESRLLLSQDFGGLNVAFNWINETDLRDSLTAFGYAAGVRYIFGSGHYEHGETTCHKGAHSDAHSEDAEHGAAHHWYQPTVGLEVYGGLGDTRTFGLRPARQEHYVQPVVMFHLGNGIMLHAGFAFGLTKASDNLLRTALAFEF